MIALMIIMTLITVIIFAGQKKKKNVNLTLISTSNQPVALFSARLSAFNIRITIVQQLSAFAVSLQKM